MARKQTLNKRKTVPKKSNTRSSLAGKPRANIFITGLIIFGVMFGGYGLWQIVSSYAASSMTSEKCNLLGRQWRSASKSCGAACQSGAGKYIANGSHLGYCSNASTESINSNQCDNLRRKFIAHVGCTRYWPQVTKKGAPQCKNSSHTYYVTSTNDLCNTISPNTGGGSGAGSGGGSGSSDAWGWPIHAKNVRLTNCFRKPGHTGIDFGVSYDPVYAARAGTVVRSGGGGDSGNYLIIRHSNGLYTNYQHLSSKLVSVGDKVTTSKQIAVSGNTGYSTGPHLHFSVTTQLGLDSRNSVAYSVNPLNYLPRTGPNVSGCGR